MKYLSIFVLFLFNIASYSNDVNKLEFEKTVKYQQAAVSYFMHDADPMVSDSDNIKSRSLSIKENLLQSLLTAPKGSYLYQELMIGLINIYVLLDELDRAQVVLTKLSNSMSHSPIIQTLMTAYSLVWDQKSYLNNLEKLQEYKDWQYTDHFVSAMKVINNSFDLDINMPIKGQYEFKKLLPNIDQHSNAVVIVVLGYKLNPDGSMDNVLIERLKAAKKAIDYYSEASVIVSGGQPAGGMTESYQMKQWLTNHRVSADKVIQDDKATDTVWNAIYSVRIIQTILANKKINNILLVTTDNHIRRASADYIQALANYGLQSEIQVHNFSALDTGYDGNKLITKREQALIIRDVLRTAGLWAIPGMVH
ncbi:YdcF family protein [Francisellaceae bacterium]|nr:YdcF family protein [Francisellaceae bacterium]